MPTVLDPSNANSSVLAAPRMSLQSALIGFLLSKFLPTRMTAQENIVLQTTAVATGTVSHSFTSVVRFRLNVGTSSDASRRRLRGYPACARLAG